MKKINIKIEGMMCEGCENRVQKALSNISGIENVNANHKTKNVEITTNDTVNGKEIIETIEDLGYEILEKESI